MAGGYQAPRNPAPVSGPGALSKRTDGVKKQGMQDLANPAYGEQGDFQEIQSGAPMSASGVSIQMPSVTALSAPTERPDEPLTAGLDSGPGINARSAGIYRTAKDQSRQDASELARYLPSLTEAANRPGTPKSFVRFVRYLRNADGQS